MADDPDSFGKPQDNRSPTELRFGRTAIDAAKSRRQMFWSLGVTAALALIVSTMVVFGPHQTVKRSFLRSWLAERHEAQRQRETEENLQRVQQVKREMEALQERSKRESEAAWKDFDKKMQALGPPVQEQQQKQEMASARAQEDSAVARQAQPLSAHSDAVVWLSISPDGNQLLSASTDRTIKLWDLASGDEVRDVGRHDDMARTALFVPGGKQVLSAADDGSIATWSLAEGKLEHTFDAKEYGGVRGLAVSADGTLAASSHELGAIVVWDLKEQRKLHVLAGHQWPANAVAISPDAKIVLSGDIDGVIRTWDLQTGKSIRQWKGHERGVYGAAFVGGGKQAVTASGDTLLKLWDVDSGREVRSFPGHAGTVYAVSVSADGQKMLSGSLDGTARLWDINSGAEFGYFDNSGNRIYSVALAGDGSVVAGDESGTIRIWAKGETRTLVAKAAQ